MTYRRKRWLCSVSICILLVPSIALGFVIFGPGKHYLRSAALLQRIADGRGDGRLADYDRHAVQEMETTVATPAGAVPARLYTPRGEKDAPAMVIVHGVHHLGINEPRLMAFSRAISASGITVLTPELKDIADYRVTEETIGTIGAAVEALHARTGTKVGLMGLSFAGGLSLMAAADARFAGDVAYVVSIGGHEDLSRVCEFFGSDKIAHPDGTIESLQAHEYGALVMAYSHLEDFFSPQDVPIAREAIRLQLWEEPEKARQAASTMSVAGRAKMDLLLSHKKDAFSAQLEQVVQEHRSEMGRVSPRGHLAGLKAPVLLLHGAGDTVIPASELLWLERDVPQGFLRSALITPVLSHVDVGKDVAFKDKWALVEFIAEMLRQADASAAQRSHTAEQRTMPELDRSAEFKRWSEALGFAG